MFAYRLLQHDMCIGAIFLMTPAFLPPTLVTVCAMQRGSALISQKHLVTSGIARALIARPLRPCCTPGTWANLKAIIGLQL